MWASRSPEEHSLIQSRRHAGLEPDQFGIRERSFGSADGLADISDDETFDRVDEPLRFATRVEKKEAESIEYRCAPTLATAQRPSAHPLHPLLSLPLPPLLRERAHVPHERAVLAAARQGAARELALAAEGMGRPQRPAPSQAPGQVCSGRRRCKWCVAASPYHASVYARARARVCRRAHGWLAV